MLFDKTVPLKMEKKLYKIVLRPSMMYGSKCWALNKKQGININDVEIRSFRWIWGVSKLDKIRNECMRGSL